MTTSLDPTWGRQLLFTYFTIIVKYLSVYVGARWGADCLNSKSNTKLEKTCGCCISENQDVWEWLLWDIWEHQELQETQEGRTLVGDLWRLNLVKIKPHWKLRKNEPRGRLAKIEPRGRLMKNEPRGDSWRTLPGGHHDGVRSQGPCPVNAIQHIPENRIFWQVKYILAETENTKTFP